MKVPVAGAIGVPDNQLLPPYLTGTYAVLQDEMATSPLSISPLPSFLP